MNRREFFRRAGRVIVGAYAAYAFGAAAKASNLYQGQLTEELLREVMRQVWNNSYRPDVIMVGKFQKAMFDKFIGAAENRLLEEAA